MPGSASRYIAGPRTKRSCGRSRNIERMKAGDPVTLEVPVPGTFRTGVTHRIVNANELAVCLEQGARRRAAGCHSALLRVAQRYIVYER